MANDCAMDREDYDWGEVGPAKSPRPSLACWYILLGLLAPFTVMTFFALGPPRLEGGAAILAVIAGPFVGGIARNGQKCCVDASLQIAYFCSPALTVGLLAQYVPLPFERGRQAVRLALWALGWLAWFLGGQLSLHAMF
jgi:hypothetical protein